MNGVHARKQAEIKIDIPVVTEIYRACSYSSASYYSVTDDSVMIIKR